MKIESTRHDKSSFMLVFIIERQVTKLSNTILSPKLNIEYLQNRRKHWMGYWCLLVLFSCIIHDQRMLMDTK